MLFTKNKNNLNGFTRILVVLTLLYSFFGIYLPYENEVKTIDLYRYLELCKVNAKISSSYIKSYKEREMSESIEYDKCISRENEFRERALQEGFDWARNQAKEKIYYIFYGWLLSYFGFFSIRWIVKGFKKG